MAEMAQVLQHGTSDTTITFLEGWRVEEFAKEAKLKIIKIFNHPHYFPFNVILSKLGINLKQKTYLNRIDIPFYDVMLTVVLKKIK